MNVSGASEEMINISEIERRGVLWILLEARNGDGKKSSKCGRKKASLYNSFKISGTQKQGCER